MITPAQQLLTEFVLEKSTDSALPLRVKLYRALASELPAKSAEFKLLTGLADDLEDIEARHQELALDFKRRAAS